MLRLLLLLLLASNVVFCWKPILPATSFTIRQQHPALGHSDNSIYEADSGTGSSINVPATITTYHGNKFVDIGDGGSTDGHVDGTLLDDTELDKAEGRILTSGFYGNSIINDKCAIDKYAFEHEGTIQYDHSLPKMEQFSLCAWMRFTNHSGDHSIFTYSVDEEPREIQFWIANAMGASYFSLAVHGQTLFRLNYPLKLRQWHHACTSWNGKTGEWQLWIKAERVGRGFHNRIVGHKIDGQGIVFSGGPSITGPIAQGLHMEVTMIQLYKVALSAGKAHRDHKHHHAHHFDHEGMISSTTVPPTPPPPQPQQLGSPILANGQIATRLRINLAGQQPAVQLGTAVHGLPSQVLSGAVPSSHQATIGTQFVSGQFSPQERFISQQLVGSQIFGAQMQQQQQPQQPTQIQTQLRFPEQPPTSYSNVGDPANVQFLDSNSQNPRLLFKRNSKNIKKRESPFRKRHDKRALVTLTDGSVIDDRVIASNPFDFDGLAQFGAPSFQQNLNKMVDIEEEIREHDREPAEGEVQAVLELCSQCDVEPFLGAVAMAWKDIKVQLDHALKGKSQGGCGHF